MFSKRAWKYAGLVCCGAVLFQAASCATMATDLVLNNLAPLIIQALLSAALGTTTATA